MPPAFRQSLQTSQRQEMLLSQRMLQAVEVLALPSAELAGYLLEAFESNEALALDETAWSERLRSEEPAPPRSRRARRASDGETDWLANQPARSLGLGELALEQLALRDVDPRVLPWAELVVSALDPTGYLSASDAALLQLAAERGLEGGEAELGRAIGLLQSLEPRGIGGRNAVEALLLQLDPADPDYALLCALLEDFLEDVARNKLPAVARALGLELAALESLLGRIRELSLRPAAALLNDAAPLVYPDVVVEAEGEGFRVRIEDSGLPPVRIDAGVRALTRDRTLGPEVRRHLRGQLDQARWLLRAVDQRRATLARVATALFAHQEPFLRHGPPRLRPLRMGELADWLGIHTSTVSRAVAGKYVQTPRGTFPLRWFFQAAAGEEIDAARTSVRDEVADVVRGEDPAEPLSDEAIQAELCRRGHRVARRTVAKYREELGIPSSYRRRRHG